MDSFTSTSSICKNGQFRVLQELLHLCVWRAVRLLLTITFDVQLPSCWKVMAIKLIRARARRYRTYTYVLPWGHRCWWTFKIVISPVSLKRSVPGGVTRLWNTYWELHMDDKFLDVLNMSWHNMGPKIWWVRKSYPKIICTCPERVLASFGFFMRVTYDRSELEYFCSDYPLSLEIIGRSSY